MLVPTRTVAEDKETPMPTPMPLTMMTMVCLAATVLCVSDGGGQPPRANPNDSLGRALEAASSRRPAGPAEAAAVLDDFHDAAAKADFDRYFGHFAASGVFLGTDPGERWTVEQFKAYARPYFREGRGWTYRPRAGKRNFTAADGCIWFDEAVDNDRYGECRGTGVLVREEGGWKIAQYSLSVPVPNELLPKVVEMIRAGAK
jgi:hypothetical protein